MGGSIFFFVESKMFEFSVEEGGTYFMLRIYERNKDSFRSVFTGKESAKRLSTYVEDLMSHSPPEQFARTFKDGNKVFILQLGFNVHGSFLMISELVHGHRKGLIIVLEGKLGSGWRGFGFHLHKAISPESLVVKLQSPSALISTEQKFTPQKSFLSAAMDGDQINNGGSRKGKLLLPNVQNSNKANQAIKSLKDNSLYGAKSPLSLEVSLNLECGLNAKWEIKHSNVKEVDCVSPSGVGPTQAVIRPNTPAKVFPLNPPQARVFKPKPSLVWQPKRKDLSTRPFPVRETKLPGMYPSSLHHVLR